MSYSNQFDSFSSWGAAADFLTEDFEAISDMEVFDAENIDNLTLSQLNELMKRYEGENENPEIFPAIIGAIAALAPVVIQGIQALTSRPAARPSAPQQSVPPPRPTYQAPIPRPSTPQPAVPRPRQALNPQPLPPAPQNPNNAINSLSALLSNPAIQQLVSGLANGIAPNAQNANNIPMGTILNTIAQLATVANSETLGEQMDSYPAFLFDNQGNLLAEPNNPQEVADLILEII